MSNAIRPWLWPGIEKEVRQVLRWKSGGPSASQTKGKIQFEDDGSNLRIPSSQTGNPVQILKFTTFDDPVEVIISDKATSIIARISSAASKKFREKQRRRITENTRGGVIQIKEFEIVVTHLGPKPSRITLLITEFNHLGSDGEGIFGCPRPIETQDGIQNFLDELRNFRSEQARSPQAPAKEEESIARLSGSSQGSDESLDEIEMGDTQPGFATQVPRRKPKRAKREGQATHLDQKGVAPVPNLNCEEVLSQAGSEGYQSRERDASPAKAITLKTIDTLSKTTGKRNNGGEQPDAKRGASLLSLLSLKRSDMQDNAETKRLTELPTLPTTCVKSSNTERPSFPSTEKVHLEDDSLVRKGRGTPRKEVQTSGISKEIPTDVYSSTTALNSHQTKSPRGKSSSSDGSSPQNSLLLDNYQARTQLQENSADKARLLTIENPVPTMERNANLGSQSITYWVDELRTESNGPYPPSSNSQSLKKLMKDPWEGMSRISRRSVTIPKDQQTLLERKDCWLPAEPGTRTPVANVPLKILQAYTMQIDTETRPERNKPSKMRQPHTSDEKTMSSGKELSSEPDIPISSADWPASPTILYKTCQLPPDSDQGEPIQSEQESLPVMSNPLDCTTSSRPLKRMKRDRLNSESDFVKSHEFDPRSEQSRLTSEEKPYQETQVCRVRKGGTPTDDEKLEIEQQLSPQQRNQQFSKSQTPEAHTEQVLVDTRAEQHLRNDEMLCNAATIGPSFVARSNSERILSPLTLMNGVNQEPEQSESDSELETTVPQPLDSRTSKDFLKAAFREPPVSTNSNEKSVLQVNRTPYSHEQKSKGRPVMGNPEQPRITSPDSFLDELPLDETISSTFENKEENKKSANNGPREDSGAASKPQRLIRENRDLVHRTTDPVISLESGELNCVVDVKNKREAGESSHDLPNITKRRKRLKMSTKFGFSQDAPASGEDPRIRAQKQRREFFATLKNDNLQSKDSTDVDFRHEVHQSDATTSNNNCRNQEFDSTTESRKNERLDSDIDTDTTASDTESSERSSFNRSSFHGAKDDRTDTRSLISELLEAAAKSDIPQSRLFQSIKPSNKSTPCPTRQSYFDLFKQTYPEYTGSETHFIAMCGKLRSLELQNRVEHRSLWDDFIVRHKIEYRQYLLQCTEQAEDPIPYEQFYREQIETSRFTKAIITPVNLRNILMPQESVKQEIVQEHRSLERQPLVKNGSNPQSVGESRQMSVASTLSSDRARIPQSVSRLSSPKRTEIVKQQDQQIKAASPSQIPKSPNKGQTTISQSPSQSAENTNQQITTTDIVDLTSYPSPHPSPTSTPLAQKPRPLPWNKPTPSTSKLIPNSSRTSPKPSPFRAVAEPPVPSTTSNSAHFKSLIPPFLPKTSSVPASPSTSTHSIHEQPAASRAPLTATSSATHETAQHTKPISPLPAEWWRDPITPFKDFMRADLAIRAGNGNAWAMEKGIGIGEGKGKGRERERKREWRRLDVLGWRL
ncbi:MAG: hypothetical protein Q9187_006834 [Circinaria calcarea]